MYGHRNIKRKTAVHVKESSLMMAIKQQKYFATHWYGILHMLWFTRWFFHLYTF